MTYFGISGDIFAIGKYSSFGVSVWGLEEPLRFCWIIVSYWPVLLYIELNLTCTDVVSVVLTVFAICIDNDGSWLGILLLGPDSELRLNLKLDWTLIRAGMLFLNPDRAWKQVGILKHPLCLDWDGLTSSGHLEAGLVWTNHEWALKDSLVCFSRRT